MKKGDVIGHMQPDGSIKPVNIPGVRLNRVIKTRPFEESMRRVMTFRVTGQMLASIATEGFLANTVQGAPEGARFLSANWDALRGCFIILLEHETFAEVPEGMMAPEFSVRFEIPDTPAMRALVTGE